MVRIVRFVWIVVFVNGLRPVDEGRGRMDEGRWTREDGGWRDEGRRTREEGGWRMDEGGWMIAFGKDDSLREWDGFLRN